MRTESFLNPEQLRIAQINAAAGVGGIQKILTSQVPNLDTVDELDDAIVVPLGPASDSHPSSPYRSIGSVLEGMREDIDMELDLDEESVSEELGFWSTRNRAASVPESGFANELLRLSSRARTPRREVAMREEDRDKDKDTNRNGDAQAMNENSPASLFLSHFSPVSSPMKDAGQSQSSFDFEGEEISGYILGPIIGHGAFSTIRTAKPKSTYSSTTSLASESTASPSSSTVVVKIVRCSDISHTGSNPSETLRRLDNEIAVWSTLNHEHILPLFSSVRTPHAYFFITLYCPAGSLYDILKRDGRPMLPMDDAGTVFRQVVRGVRYLHEVVGVVHGDLKLENVLVDEMGMCRIGDFGFAKRVGEVEAVADSSDGEDEFDINEHDNEKQSHPSATNTTTTKKPTRHATPGLPIHLSLLRKNGPGRHRKSMPASQSQYQYHQYGYGYNAGERMNLNPNQPTRYHPGSLPYAAPELLMGGFGPFDYQPGRSGLGSGHSRSGRHGHAGQYANVNGGQTQTQTQGEKGAANPAQDIWALGVLLYALLTGRLPFADTFEPRLQMKILQGSYELPTGIGHGAEEVLKGCLRKDVGERWTIAMVDDVAWGVGWGDVDGPIIEGHELEHQDEQQRPGLGRKSSNSRSRTRSRGAPYEPLESPYSPLLGRSRERDASRSISRARRRRSLSFDPSTSRERRSDSVSASRVRKGDLENGVKVTLPEPLEREQMHSSLPSLPSLEESPVLLSRALQASGENGAGAEVERGRRRLSNSKLARMGAASGSIVAGNEKTANGGPLGALGFIVNDRKGDGDMAT